MDEPITAAMTQQQEVAVSEPAISDAAWERSFSFSTRECSESCYVKAGLVLRTREEWDARCSEMNRTLDRAALHELMELRAEAVKAREHICELMRARYDLEAEVARLRLGWVKDRAELERLRKGVMPNGSGTYRGNDRPNDDATAVPDAVAGAASAQTRSTATTLLTQPATDPRLGRGRGAME